MNPPSFVDLAALDGEVPDLIPVAISRDAIENKDCASLLATLRSLSADRETTLRMRGRILLTTDGYNEDQRPLAVMVHDMVMRFAGWIHRLGGVLADRPNLEAVLAAGHSAMIYPGGSRETFRPFWERKQVTLGHRTGFVKQALRYRVPITPVVSVGMHETFFVLWRGAWLANRLGITRHLRADVFPIVAGLPFGVWLGVTFPQLPLPAKLTVEVLPPIDVAHEAEQRLGRPLLQSDIDDDPDLSHTMFHLVRDRMQSALDRLYAERRYPVLG